MHRQNQWLAIHLLTAFIVTSLGGSSQVAAHEGPPFPILMDQPSAGYVVSVWADPDIGDATFFVILETTSGEMPTTVPEVQMWYAPVSGRLDRATCVAEHQELRNQLQFKAVPYFDQRDQWTVGFQIQPATGAAGELTTEVESTPPGYGLWDFVIYLFPFLFLGGAWLLAMVRRTRARTATATPDNESAVRTEIDSVNDSADEAPTTSLPVAGRG